MDEFAEYRHGEEHVPVGMDTLVVSTSKLYQDEAVFRALGALDLDKLGDAIAGLVGSVRLDDLKGGRLGDAVRKLAPQVPAIWAALRRVLGEQLVPCIRDIAVAMLDTRENAQILTKAGRIEGVDPEKRGRWMGNEIVRDYMLDNLSTLQEYRVVAAAFRVSRWGDVLGNLLPLAAAGTPGEKPSAETLAQTH